MTTPTVPTFDEVAQPSAAAAAMQADVEMCRDLAGGTKAVRAARTTYLPQAPGEKDRDYNIRLARPAFFDAFGQTINGLVGMVFRRDPALDQDVPDKISQQAEAIDLEGTHLAVFAKEIFRDAWVVGHGGILVDYPTIESLPRWRSQEAALGLRPYWVWYRKEDILRWRTVKERGKLILTLLVLRESAVEPIGDFGERAVTRYRVLRRILTPTGPSVTYATYEQRDDRKELTPGPAGVIRKQSEIPFAPVYSAKKTGFLESDPPLLELGYLNIQHYQVQSDHLHALHKASVPILVRIGAVGADGEELVVGPNTALDVPINGDVKYVEHSGAALGQTRQQLQDIKADMAVLGLRMLMHETRAAETATAKRIDKAEQDSALSTAARGLQDGIELALQFHAAFLGLDSGGSFKVNREFERLQLTGADIDVYAKRVGEGMLSLETLWDIMQRAGHLPEDFDPELERDRIGEGMLLGMGDGSASEDGTGSEEGAAAA